MSMEKKIQDIEFGMVFDHLGLGTGARVFDVLKSRVWSKEFRPIIVGSFPSQQKGRKDIAKLDGLHLDEGSPGLNEIALLSPDATVNWIDQGKVVKKKNARDCVADSIESPLVECANSNCISHEEAPQKFHVRSRQPLVMECYYCTREFSIR